MQQLRHFSTPFPKLDEALGEHLCAGQFILCAGLTGNGKTILAGQLAAHFVCDQAKVLFVSTEVEHEDLFKRIVSASGSIPYASICDHIDLLPVDISPTLKISVPAPRQYGSEAASAAFRVILEVRRNQTFCRIDSLDFAPQAELNRLLTRYKIDENRFPDAIVFDYLGYPKVRSREEINPFKMRQAVLDAASALKTMAHERNILVIAFCQADPSLTQSRKILPAAIAEVKGIQNFADAFIGMSHRRKADNDESASNGVYERIQHFTVITGKSGPPVMIPVERDFKFQRFVEPRWSPRSTGIEESSDMDRQARMIEQTSEFPGYVLARRKKFYGIFPCGVPYAINLYAFLLLVSGIKDHRAGMSFYSREVLACKTGLTVKQLRRATDTLMDCGFLNVPIGRVHQSLRYEILDWKDDQNLVSPGYFKLFRNLRSAKRTDLLSDPLMFRVWLYLLAEARSFADESQEVSPGDVLFDHCHAEEVLEIRAKELATVMDKLEARGSICWALGDLGRLTIVNWILYQNKVHAPRNRPEANAARQPWSIDDKFSCENSKGTAVANAGQ